jgi:hypothetical protein
VEHPGGGGKLIVGSLVIAGATVEPSKAEAALSHEGAHPEPTGERLGASVTALGLGRGTAGRDFA